VKSVAHHFGAGLLEARGTPQTRASYRHCASVTRRSGSNFASAFWLLPRPRRQALYAVYAFCRLADDIADDVEVVGDRQELLERWRGELEAAFRGVPNTPVGVALADSARRYELCEGDFQDLLRGIESDLRGEDFRNSAELERYCYQVAGTVGRVLVRILGCGDPASLAYAEAMGTAVQLTNILRDVWEDAKNGRIYLALEDMDRMGVVRKDLEEPVAHEALRLLLAQYAERARIHYERADALLPAEQRWRLRGAQAMGRIYRVLLEELAHRGFANLAVPIRLSSARRMRIATAAWLGIER